MMGNIMPVYGAESEDVEAKVEEIGDVDNANVEEVDDNANVEEVDKVENTEVKSEAKAEVKAETKAEAKIEKPIEKIYYLIYSDKIKEPGYYENPITNVNTYPRGGFWIYETMHLRYLQKYQINPDQIVYRVNVPSDATKVNNFRYITVDKINVLDKVCFKDLEVWSDSYFCEMAIDISPQFIEYIHEVPGKITADDMERFYRKILYNTDNLRYIPNPTYKMYETIVKDEPRQISIVPIGMQTYELARIAIGWRDPMVYHINATWTEEQLLEKFKKFTYKNYPFNVDGLNLQYIRSDLLDDDLCFNAVHNDGRALQYVPGFMQTKKMCVRSRQLKYIHDKTMIDENMCLQAVQFDGLELEFVPRIYITNVIKSEAVNQNGMALKFITANEQTNELCLQAVMQNSKALRYVHNPSQKLIAYAISRDSDAWKCL